MRNALLLSLLSGWFSLTGAYPCLVDQSICLGETRETKDPALEDTVTFLPAGDTLVVLHTAYEWYCCLEASLEIDVQDTEIYLTEINRNGVCRCICTYDLSYTVQDIPPGTYTVHLINHDGEEIAAEKLEFPADAPPPRKLTMSKCEPVEPSESPWDTRPETIAFIPDANALVLAHQNLVTQCCLQFVVRYTIGADFITIHELDQAEVPCPCLCSFDLELTVPDVPHGTYLVTLYGSGGGVKAEELVTITEATAFRFIRGEANGDGAVDIGDAITILTYLFSNGPPLPCDDVADVNDDGELNLADVVALLAYLFREFGTIAEPYPNLGYDLTPDVLPCR